MGREGWCGGWVRCFDVEGCVWAERGCGVLVWVCVIVGPGEGLWIKCCERVGDAVVGVCFGVAGVWIEWVFWW